jgi:alkylation response protein AidB-like acyl-CoA dehydrogenase
MPICFDIPQDARKLLAEVRDWSLHDVRPLARQADREQSKYFAEGRSIMANCPIQVSPLSVPEFGCVDKSGHKYVASDTEEGNHVLGALVMEAMTYGDGWAWGALPRNANLEKMLKVIGTPEQLERWVEPFHTAEETHQSSFAFTEEGCGSDISGIQTRAVRDGDEWVINGVKRFSSQGAEATIMLVFVTIDPSLGMRGLRGVVIPRDTPGIEIIRETEDLKLGMRMLRQSTIRFNDVRIPLDHMLGAENDAAGFLEGLNVLNRTRPFCMAWNVGTVRGATDFVRDWLKGQPNGFNPQRFRRIEEDLQQIDYAMDDLMRLILRAAWRADRGLPCRVEAAMAKSHGPQACDRAYRRLLQIMGSEGSSEQHLVEKWYRDAVTFDLLEGTSQILKLTVSRGVFAAAQREAGDSARAALQPITA